MSAYRLNMPTILYRRSGTIKFRVLVANNKHGDFGAIFAGVPDLPSQANQLGTFVDRARTYLLCLEVLSLQAL
jgi:hypothetical protein